MVEGDYISHFYSELQEITSLATGLPTHPHFPLPFLKVIMLERREPSIEISESWFVAQLCH